MNLHTAYTSRILAAARNPLLASPLLFYYNDAKETHLCLCTLCLASVNIFPSTLKYAYFE